MGKTSLRFGQWVLLLVSLNMACWADQLLDDFGSGSVPDSGVWTVSSAGTASVAGGQLLLTPPDADWSRVGIASKAGFQLSGGDGFGTALEVRLDQAATTVNGQPEVGSDLWCPEHPGIWVDLVAEILLTPTAGLIEGGIAEASGEALSLFSYVDNGTGKTYFQMWRKRPGQSDNGTLVGERLFDGGGPWTTGHPMVARLILNSDTYSVEINGTKVFGGSHYLGSQAALNLLASSTTGGRGTLHFDHVRVGDAGSDAMVGCPQGGVLFNDFSSAGDLDDYWYRVEDGTTANQAGGELHIQRNTFAGEWGHDISQLISKHALPIHSSFDRLEANFTVTQRTGFKGLYIAVSDHSGRYLRRPGAYGVSVHFTDQWGGGAWLSYKSSDQKGDSGDTNLTYFPLTAAGYPSLPYTVRFEVSNNECLLSVNGNVFAGLTFPTPLGLEQGVLTIGNLGNDEGTLSIDNVDFRGIAVDPSDLSGQPYVKTGPRLLKLGETFTFECLLPDGMSSNELRIFSCYLEQGDPGVAFAADGGLDWLDGRPSETVALTFADGSATANYTATQPGNYLLRWDVGTEKLYRYFSVVDDDSVVVRFFTHLKFDALPTLHATGIPLSYRLPARQFVPSLYFYEIGHEFKADDSLYQLYREYNRRYGDMIVVDLPDTPHIADANSRFSFYQALIDTAAPLIYDQDDLRSVRIDKAFYGDGSYPAALNALGVNDHCGMWVAHGGGWLGMPEFPYFVDPDHILRADQSTTSDLVSHQWDFSGSFHFLGPADWHYAAAQGDVDAADHCVEQGLAEAALGARMSGHPIFLTPLYDGAPSGCWIWSGYGQDWNAGLVHEYVEHYQRKMAFEHTAQHGLVFARTLDIADYYRRHFATTPRTVFSSTTDHITYDGWWMDTVHNAGVNWPINERPWETSPTQVTWERRHIYGQKDPKSLEYLHVEDSVRQIRFERNAPVPIWWFDYTDDSYWRNEVVQYETWKEMPEVSIEKLAWDGNSIRLRMNTNETFADYAICLWGVPAELVEGAGVPKASNAKELIVAGNTAGEHHLVIFFDLSPDLEIEVRNVLPGSCQDDTYIACDFNRDCRVDFEDFAALVADWLTSNPQYDLNQSGEVDCEDFAVFAVEWLQCNDQDDPLCDGFVVE